MEVEKTGQVLKSLGYSVSIIRLSLNFTMQNDPNSVKFNEIETLFQISYMFRQKIIYFPVNFETLSTQ